MEVKTFNPQQIVPANVIFPQQVHQDKIVEIITGQEDLTATDGLFTSNDKFLLGVRTADCAPVVFISQNKFGIIHVGWRGLCQNICENMLVIFSPEKDYHIFCGPFLPQFKIKNDFCYKAIEKKFGQKFFSENDSKIIFNFQAAILSILKTIEFDGRSTYGDKSLASWRRDKKAHVNNITVVGNF